MKKLQVPECSHAYSFRKQGLKVYKIIEILNMSKNWVMKWSVLGETGEFSVVVFTGSQFNISESADDMKSFHNCIMMSS